MSNAMRCHAYQRAMCDEYKELGPILNAACKEDPAKLGKDFGALNLDLETYDVATKIHLDKAVVNYKQGSILDADTLFDEGTFGLIVLGEFIEHCVPSVCADALTACRKILKDDGRIVLTFPLDDREPKKQHGEGILKVWVTGETGHDITLWHQTVWEDDMLTGLFEKTGFEEVKRQEIGYGFLSRTPPQGWGIVLKKAQ